jgi:hypothetical protein
VRDERSKKMQKRQKGSKFSHLNLCIICSLLILKMTDSAATVSRSSSTNAASNILSEKLARALQVRTDTPAMKAVLDALSRLPDAGEMDSHSVRVAIERDALTPSPVFTRRITNAC